MSSLFQGIQVETIVVNMYSNCQTTKVHFVWRPVCLQIIRWSKTK